MSYIVATDVGKGSIEGERERNELLITYKESRLLSLMRGALRSISVITRQTIDHSSSHLQTLCKKQLTGVYRDYAVQ